ncbi:MAG: type II toxin-antitoxin system HicA family toxin [archaeon]
MRFEKLGYEIVRQKGSHVRMIHRSDNSKAPITVPLHQTVGRGLLRKILKQSEISVNEFNDLA